MASIRELSEGMKILAKYLPLGEDTQIGGAEHDIVYVSPPDVTVSVEDALKLDDLGWHFSYETGWGMFV